MNVLNKLLFVLIVVTVATLGLWLFITASAEVKVGMIVTAFFAICLWIGCDMA